MANNISLSSSMRTNLLSLQNTSLLQDMTQERLSTGKKVNSALDNPSAYFTAQSLNNRASDLSSRLDSIGQALQTLKAADKSLTSLTKLVEQAKALASQAQEAVNAAGLLSTQELKDVANLGAVGGAGSTVSLIFTSAVADGTIKFNVNGGATREVAVTATSTIGTVITNINTAINQDGAYAYWDSTNKQIQISAVKGTTVQINDGGAGTMGTFLFSSSRIGSSNIYTFAAPSSTDALTHAFAGVTTGTDVIRMTVTDTTNTATTVSISLSSVTSVASFAAAFNTSNSNITATFNTSTNRIEFTGTQGYKLQLDDSTGTAADAIFGGSKIGSDNATTFGDATGNTTVSNNLADFKDVMSQIDAMVTDASYKGKNLLKGSDSLSVLFNEDGSSKMTISGVNFTHDSGLGFSTSSGLAWDTAGKIQTSIDQAKAAVDTIRSQQNKFGTANSVIQTREDFTKNMIDTLKGGADRLTLADMNEEAANMLALQTQRQLATNSLTMASQAAQSVLQLFR